MGDASSILSKKNSLRVRRVLEKEKHGLMGVFDEKKCSWTRGSSQSRQLTVRRPLGDYSISRVFSMLFMKAGKRGRS